MILDPITIATKGYIASDLNVAIASKGYVDIDSGTDLSKLYGCLYLGLYANIYIKNTGN